MIKFTGLSKIAKENNGKRREPLGGKFRSYIGGSLLGLPIAIAGIGVNRAGLRNLQNTKPDIHGVDSLIEEVKKRYPEATKNVYIPRGEYSVEDASKALSNIIIKDPNPWQKIKNSYHRGVIANKALGGSDMFKSDPALLGDTRAGILSLPKRLTNKALAAHEFGHLLRSRKILDRAIYPVRLAGPQMSAVGSLMFFAGAMGSKHEDGNLSNVERAGLGVAIAPHAAEFLGETAANIRGARLLKQINPKMNLIDYLKNIKNVNLKAYGGSAMFGLGSLLGSAIALKAYYRRNANKMKNRGGGVENEI